MGEVMRNTDFEVFLVDDDPGILKALARLLRAAGYKTKSFSSSEAFLEQHDPAVPGCAVLDIAMPDFNGLALQEKLIRSGIDLPIIFLTGHGNVPMTVRAMQAGAVDFLLKPLKGSELLKAVGRAVDRDQACRQTTEGRNDTLTRLDVLTRREREVLSHVIGGRLNKQIAADLGTVEKTIKVHRSRMMAKMGVRSVAELVRLTERIGLQPAAHPTLA
jgi:FixJ family two-component response regulator